MEERYLYPFPKELVTHVSAICGTRGEAWLSDLPELIRELSVIWSLEVHEPFPAGEFNFVAAATRSDGESTVLKIAPPYEDGEFKGEAGFLRHRNGRGTVALLAEDPERRAVLLERAVPGLNLSELFTGREEDAIDPAITVLRSISGEPPDTHPDIKTVDEWFDGMRRARGTAFPEKYTSKAFETYGRLSRQPGRIRYLHGDFHPGNIVKATRSPYLAIDPKGVIGHIGYDIAVFLNNYHWWQETQSDIRERLHVAVKRFADAFEIDPFELREWAYAQMVLGAWWSCDEMPDHYENSTVAKADIWNV